MKCVHGGGVPPTVYSQCFQYRLWIHCILDQNESVNEDELMNDENEVTLSTVDTFTQN